MIELIQVCSPSVQVPIASAIIKNESGFNQFAIGVNHGRAIRQPTTYQEAVSVAKSLIADGANIDMGLAQINSANLDWLGLTVEQIFNPCTNLQAMQTIYLECYNRAGNDGLGTRMQRAFSCYNTGNMKRGFSNGYVNKVTANFNAFAGNTKNTPRTSVESDQELLATQYHKISTNPNSEPVRVSSGHSQMVDVVQAHEVAKIYHAWDVFREF